MPFYPLLLHRKKGAALESEIRRCLDITVAKTAPLGSARQSDVMASFIDVVTRWKPNLAALLENIVMTQYKIDPETSLWFRAGRDKGLAEGTVKGQLEHAHETLLRLGAKRFRKPSAKVRKTIESITDLDRLNALIVRVLDVNSWAELLADEAG